MTAWLDVALIGVTPRCLEPGGIVKAEGLGDGRTHQKSRHRQAALDDATRADCYLILDQAG